MSTRETMPKTPHLTHWIGTDVGLVRELNEDAFLWLGPEETRGHGHLWVLADGMGGASAGDLASALLVLAIGEIYPEVIDQTEDPYAALEAAILEGNRRIVATSEAYPALRGMGTTVVALAIREGYAYIAHVGDSRCYRYRDGRMEATTEDHTRAEHLISLGYASRQEAESQPDAGVLSRVVGRPGLEIDFGARRPTPVSNDVFLLCTDGVWGSVTTDHLRLALERLQARDAVEAVVEMARRNWSDDNLTAAVVRAAPPNPDSMTSRDAFLDWVDGGFAAHDDLRTMVLRAVGTDGVLELPPRTNVTRIPTITARAAPAQSEEPTPAGPVRTAKLTPVDANPAVRDSTIAFSPQDVAALRASLGDAPAPGSDPTVVGATTVFSPQDVAALRAQTAPPPVQGSNPLESDASTSTIVFSPQDVAALRTQGGPLPVQGSNPLESDASTSTIVFSPQDVAALRAGAPASSSGNASTLFFARSDVDKRLNEADSSLHGSPSAKGAPQRARTMAMSQAEVAALAQSAHSSNGANDTIEIRAQKKRSMWPVVLLVVLFVGATVYTVGYFFLKGPTIPDPPASESDDGQAARDARVAHDDPSPSPQVFPPPPPLIAPPEPRAPDGMHVSDQMPYFRVGESAGEAALLVDAHEVSVGQMARLRRALPDMELVYASSSRALYEHAPCEGTHLQLADPSSLRPVCAAPEAAEAYCSAVGRRLPSEVDWTRILESGASVIAPARGDHAWELASYGPAPVVEPLFEGIQGVYDGLPEILRPTQEQMASGELPLLMMTESGRPFSRRRGLLDDLRRRTLDAERLPILGFRCVLDDQPEAVQAASTSVAVQAFAIAETAAEAPRTETVSAGMNRVAPGSTADGDPSPGDEGAQAAQAQATPGGSELRAPLTVGDAAGAQPERNSQRPGADAEPSTPRPPITLGQETQARTEARTEPAAEASPARRDADPPASNTTQETTPAREPSSGATIPTAGTSTRRLASQSDRDRQRREAEAATVEPTVAAPRIQLMDPMYLPSTIEEYEERVQSGD